MKITYVVLDDEKLLRKAIVKYIRKHYLEEADQIIDFEDADTLISQLPRISPPLNVCILDVNMPGINNGIDACRAIKEISPLSKVYMLTSYDDEVTEQACLEAGAEEVVIKIQTAKGMRLCIQGIIRSARGETYNPLDTNN